EPRLPRRPSLIQQHAEAVDRAVAALARGGEKRRFERDINDVDGERASRQLVESNVERGLADHAATRGVDDHRRTVERIVALLPRQRLDRAAELIGDALRAGERAVDEPDLLRAFLREAVAHRA